MNKRGVGIRRKMLFSFGAFSVLSLLATILLAVFGIPFTGFSGSYGDRQSLMLKSMSMIANLKKSEILDWAEERKANADIIATDNDFRRYVGELVSRSRSEMPMPADAGSDVYKNIIRHLTTLQRQYEYRSLSMLDARNGITVVSTDQSEIGMPMSGNIAFEEVASGLQEHMFMLRMDDKTGRMFLHLLHGVREHEEIGGARIIAVLSMKINISDLTGHLPESFEKTGETTEVVFVDRELRILGPLKCRLPDGSEARPFHYRDTAKPAVLAAGGSEGLTIADDYCGVPVLAAFRHIRLSSGLGLGMIVKIDKSEAFAPLYRDLAYSAAVALFFSAIVVIITWLTAARLAGPITKLGETVRSVEDGNISARSDIRTGDEIEILSNAFNSMIDRIAGWNSALEREVESRTSQLLAANEELEREIVRRQQSEEQLVQAQKMEAVGQLAGGVAHDFNNILSAINGYAYLSMMKTDDEAVRQGIEQVIELTRRAAGLTQSLLAFSRKQTVNLAVIDLNELMARFEKLIRRLLREDIELRLDCAAGALYVMADAAQIEQSLMNLVTNARDAMPSGGCLTLATSVRDVSGEFTGADGLPLHGKYAVISVSDTGTGIDAQTRTRIFEPFFTTKEVGKGTGLGLAMVYGIVRKHNGFIDVTSEPGRGTTFNIYIPSAGLSKVAEDSVIGMEDEIAGGSETILLAEDDATLRKLFTATLGQYGYSIVEASDGADAVAKFAAHADDISLVILDGIMPRMNGKEAFISIRALRPDVKCLFVSGYAEDVFTKDGIPQEPTIAFLTKPVAPPVLLGKVREVLDTRIQ